MNANVSIYTIPSAPYFGILLFSEIICAAGDYYELLIPAVL